MVPYRIFWKTKKLQILCDYKLISLKSNYSFNRRMVFTHTCKTINSIISSFKKLKLKTDAILCHLFNVTYVAVPYRTVPYIMENKEIANIMRLQTYFFEK